MSSVTTPSSVSQSSLSRPSIDSFVDKAGGIDCMAEICSFLPSKEERALSLVDRKVDEVLAWESIRRPRILKRIDEEDELVLPRHMKKRLKSIFIRAFEGISPVPHSGDPDLRECEELYRRLREEDFKRLEETCDICLSTSREIFERSMEGEDLFVPEYQTDNVEFFDLLFGNVHERVKENLFRERDEVREIEAIMQSNPFLRNSKGLLMSAVKSGNFAIFNRMRTNGTVDEKLELFSSAVKLFNSLNRTKSRVEILVCARAVFGAQLEEVLNAQGQNRQSLRELADPESQNILDYLFESLDMGQIPPQENIIHVRNAPTQFQLQRRQFSMQFTRPWQWLQKVPLVGNLFRRHPNRMASAATATYMAAMEYLLAAEGDTTLGSVVNYWTYNPLRWAINNYLGNPPMEDYFQEEADFQETSQEVCWQR